eukprot:TRINITY_DN15904_c0_g1_i2.p1 TRINITY_DN15904_c0_g1~~TRINITY_DN15904_c0_g1_i2.p1  ORF type:complete len:759 (+),score=87.88 TRINITY_DN15904_c0_g1_i2:1833-4109(+)
MSCVERGIRCTDPHTASDQFVEWYSKEVELTGHCPADWHRLMPRFGGACLSLYQQDTLGYLLPPVLLPASSTGRVPDLARPKPDKRQAHLRVTILFASEFGTCEAFAHRLRTLLRCRHKTAAVAVVCLSNYNVAELVTEDVILFLLSTSWHGWLPQNGAAFFQKLQEHDFGLAEHAPMRNTAFGLFSIGSRALGNALGGGWPPTSTADEFCGHARLLHRKLLLLGARPLVPVPPKEVDAAAQDIELTFAEWADQMWEGVRSLSNAAQLVPPPYVPASSLQMSGTPSHFEGGLAADWWNSSRTTAFSIRFPDDDHTSARKGRLATPLRPSTCPLLAPDQGFAAVVTNVTELTKQSARHRSWQVFLEPAAGGSAFPQHSPGDCLAVWPKQPLRLLEELLARLDYPSSRWDATIDFNVHVLPGEEEGPSCWDQFPKASLVAPTSVRYLLGTQLDPSAPLTPLALHALAAHAADSGDSDRLTQLATDFEEYSLWLQDGNRHGLLEVLNEFPSIGTVPLAELCIILPPSNPRLYCITSCYQPQQVQIVISDGFGSTPSGLCSQYLVGNASRRDDRVRCAIVPVQSFRPPVDTTEPVVCVSFGVGIAPFRAFWQQAQRERIALKDKGREIIMIHGCGTPGLDNLFESELERNLLDHTFSSCRVAYLQAEEADRRGGIVAKMLDTAKSLWECLAERRGCVFVAGDLATLHAVRGGLLTIAMQHGKLGRAGAFRWLAELAAEGRFRQLLLRVPQSTPLPQLFPSAP